jgi:predicted RNase H-like nuclease (RuvC/YqgF family)
MKNQGKKISLASREDMINQGNEEDVEMDTPSIMTQSDRSNGPAISQLHEQIDRLQNENESLKEKMNSMEIDNVCLEHKNAVLESRIDDFAIRYPQASILLGRKPVESQKSRLLTLKFRKKE